MKILHLSARDNGGGAFSAALRLHQSLLDMDLESRMFVGNKSGTLPTVSGPEHFADKAWSRVAPKLDRALIRFFGYPTSPYRSSGLIGSGVPRMLRQTQWDVLTLHWVAGGFMVPRDIQRIATQPVVWRLPDMWPIAGTEHYVGDSVRYIGGYGQVRNEGKPALFDLDLFVWQNKKRFFELIPELTIVAPSQWLADCVKQSLMFPDRRVEVIPTGQDLEVFRPHNRDNVRDEFGFASDARVVLFGAAGSRSDPRKGARYINGVFEGLRKIDPGGNYQLAVFGEKDWPSGDSSIKVSNFGVIGDLERLSRLYSASDVFLAPSKEENLANTVIESMAAGTPVVAFDIGGMPDIIIHGQNGYLAKPFEEIDLAHGIVSVLRGPRGRDPFREAARKTTERKFSLQAQARSYAHLYEQVVKGSRLRDSKR